jgi:hypothetical protein
LTRCPEACTSFNRPRIIEVLTKSRKEPRRVVEIELATPADVADALHTTVAALSQDRYLNRGVPYIKHGRRVLYRWSDVRQYLEANTVVPGGAA